MTLGGGAYHWQGGGNVLLTGDVLNENGDLLASGTLKSGTWDTPIIGLLNDHGGIELAGAGADPMPLWLIISSYPMPILTLASPLSSRAWYPR